jgi:antitoxin component of MazEF toxin-antitoxin module
LKLPKGNTVAVNLRTDDIMAKHLKTQEGNTVAVNLRTDNIMAKRLKRAKGQLVAVNLRTLICDAADTVEVFLGCIVKQNCKILDMRLSMLKPTR